MAHKIKFIETKKDLILAATFFDGTIKEYDVKQLFGLYPQLNELEKDHLFDKVQIDTGGYGISWNDDLDLDAETIWEEGVQTGKRLMSYKLELAARLSEAREKAGMTQKELSEKTGIYQADISKLERGIGNPSLSTLERLAEGMGVILKIDFQ